MATTSTSPADTSYAALGLERLSSLWRATLQRELPGEVRDAFLDMMSPWGLAPRQQTPAWPSAVTEDHTPFAFSAVLGGATPELHVVVEAQGAQPSFSSNAAAGLALNQVLARRGADLSAFDKIKDLFLPSESSARFAIWHTAVFAPGKAPTFGVVLNPQVKGEEWAYAVAEEAMDRLGFTRSWPYVTDVAHRCTPRDEIRTFSLSLSSEPQVELQVHHHEASSEDLERSARTTPGYAAGTVTEFCKSLAGGTGPFITPFATRISFSSKQRTPVTCKFELPLRTFVEHDRAARERLQSYLGKKGLTAAAYEQALEAAARRPLDSAKGLVASVSLDLQDRKQLTLHLAPQLFAATPAGAPDLSPPPMGSPEDIVQTYEKHSIANHPFFQHARRNPVDVSILWMLQMNIREGIVRYFTRRLANLIWRTEDVRIRSILGKQLNDELGDGDATRAHAPLFDVFIEGLDSFRPKVIPPGLLEPGNELSQRLENIYVKSDPFVGVGSAMVIEIIGKQGDTFMGDEFRRQKAIHKSIPPAALEWLDLHEKLELEHSDESLDLARLVPADPQAIASAWSGARECGAACWAVLDGLYRLSYAPETMTRNEPA